MSRSLNHNSLNLDSVWPLLGSASRPERTHEVPDRPDRQARAAETREALKAAARRVFARQACLGAKIVDIAREAGGAAGCFYSHFASEGDLLEALAADLVAGGARHGVVVGTAKVYDEVAELR